VRQKYLLVLLIFFILYPSIVLGNIKIGVSPVKIGGSPKCLTKSYQEINLKGERRPFLSKFNPFSKILNFISNLFQKKREFDIKIPIPPPPPPPDIAIQSLPQPQIQSKFEIYFNQKKVYNNTTNSPWQWF